MKGTQPPTTKPCLEANQFSRKGNNKHNDAASGVTFTHKMFQSFDEKVANVSLAFELMMDGGLPQPKVTDIDGDDNKMEVMMKMKVMVKT